MPKRITFAYAVLFLAALVTASALIPRVALTAAGLAVGDTGLPLGALRRVGVDLALIVILGGAVFTWKQRRVRRRRPLP
jgi:hypothetical protein